METEQEEVEQGGGYPSWKRALDVAFVIVTAPLWLPLMILIAVGIQIVSPGNVFFRQERIGMGGGRFMIFKFRSMKVNAETEAHVSHLDRLIESDCPMTKLDRCGDARIFPLGRILRATGLDELPQIFNVVRGEMSIVGPRPCTPHEFVRYSVPQRRRFDVIPGITGYWQVNGKNRTTFSEMVAMDIHYANSLSLGLDLLIMIKTIPAIAVQVSEALPRFIKKAGK